MTCPHVNDVALVGRLSGEPRRRPLPSGDELVSWRLVVERPAGHGGRAGVDTIPCVTFDRMIGAMAGDWRHGDVLEIRGALRRRFWRAAGGGAVNRCEVEVREAEVVAVAEVGPAAASEEVPEEADADAERPGPDGTPYDGAPGGRAPDIGASDICAPGGGGRCGGQSGGRTGSG